MNKRVGCVLVMALITAAVLVWAVIESGNQVAERDEQIVSAANDTYTAQATKELITVTLRQNTRLTDGLTRSSAEDKAVKAICELRDYDMLTNRSVNVVVEIDLIDATGNQHWGNGIDVLLTPQTVALLDCQGNIDITVAADFAIVHEVLQ